MQSAATAGIRQLLVELVGLGHHLTKYIEHKSLERSLDGTAPGLLLQIVLQVVQISD